MTVRKYHYRRGSGPTQASKVRDEVLFCKDRPCEEFENPFRSIIWRLKLCDRREEVASIWFHHKDEVLPQWSKDNPGTRPRAFFVFEMNVDVNDIPACPKDQALLLARHGHLTVAERKRLPNDWFSSKAPKLKII